MSDKGGGVRESCYQKGVGCEDVKGSVAYAAKSRLAAASADRRNSVSGTQRLKMD